MLPSLSSCQEDGSPSGTCMYAPTSLLSPNGARPVLWSRDAGDRCAIVCGRLPPLFLYVCAQASHKMENLTRIEFES